MKSDEIIEAAKGVEAAVETDVKKARGWLGSAWTWAKGTSWKTKAVVGVILLTGLLCGMASLYTAPSYVTASDANKMLAEHEDQLNKKIKTLSEHADTLDAGLHNLDSRVKELEAKPAPITTGSISKKKVSVKKPARKPASSWFDLP